MDVNIDGNANVSGDVNAGGNVNATGGVVVGGTNVGTTLTNLDSRIDALEAAATFSGTATLSSGTVTVNNANVTASAKIFLQRNTAAGTTTNNVYHVTARDNGVSFTITAIVLSTGLTGASDTSTIDWLIVP